MKRRGVPHIEILPYILALNPASILRIGSAIDFHDCIQSASPVRRPGFHLSSQYSRRNARAVSRISCQPQQAASECAAEKPARPLRQLAAPQSMRPHNSGCPRPCTPIIPTACICAPAAG